jgi:hypothetical protein
MSRTKKGGAGAGRKTGTGKIDLSREALEADLRGADVDSPADFGLDPFCDLDSEGLRIELERTEPKEYRGDKTAGFICEIGAGWTKQRVAEEFGGGSYIVKVRMHNAGRMSLSERSRSPVRRK